MAIVEVTIVPMGTATTSLSRYVADCHKVLMAAEDLKYELNPMGTVIEGSCPVFWKSSARCTRFLLPRGREGCQR